MESTEMNSDVETEDNREKRRPFKVRKYFFEFLMIFLGVTAGFLLDNYREGKAEESEEMDYVKSYLKDIEKDRRELEANSEFGKVTIMGHDSLSNELLKKPLKGREKRLYHFFNLQNTGILIPHNDRTITQLKYSGKFRLIRNQRIADAIIDYDTKLTEASKEIFGDYKMNISNNTLIDLANVFDMPLAYKFADRTLANKEEIEKVGYPEDLILLNYDEKLIMHLRNTLVQGRAYDLEVLKDTNALLKINKSLDSLIRKEYGIE
jgi:hypothetical protein